MMSKYYTHLNGSPGIISICLNSLIRICVHQYTYIMAIYMYTYFFNVQK